MVHWTCFHGRLSAGFGFIAVEKVWNLLRHLGFCSRTHVWHQVKQCDLWKSCAGTKVWRLFLPEWGLRCGAREGAADYLSDRFRFWNGCKCQPGGGIFFGLARPPRKCAKVQNAPSGATLIAADGPRRPEKLHVAMVADWMISLVLFPGEAKVVRITSVAEVQKNPVLPGQEKWPWVQSDAHWYSHWSSWQVVQDNGPKKRLKSKCRCDSGMLAVSSLLVKRLDMALSPVMRRNALSWADMPPGGIHTDRILEWTDFQGSKSSIVTSSSTTSSWRAKPRLGLLGHLGWWTLGCMLLLSWIIVWMAWPRILLHWTTISTTCCGWSRHNTMARWVIWFSSWSLNRRLGPGQ